MKKKIGLLTLALLVTFTMIGCEEGVTPQLVFNSYAEEASNEATTEALAKSDRTEFFTLDHVAIGDYVMVLNGFSFSEGEEWAKPSEGHQFVNFDITVHNVSTELKSISSLFVFELRDTLGDTFGSILSKEDLPRLDGIILPGGFLNGVVAFEVPVDSDLETLIFDYSLFSTGQVTFALNSNSEASQLAVESSAFINPSAGVESKAIGDVLRFGDAVYKVVGYRTSAGSADYQAKAGYVYLIFEISVDNISPNPLQLSNHLDFTLQCENGYNYPLVFAPDLKGDLQGELPSGKSLSGEIAFEVPEGTACNLILSEMGNFYVVGEGDRGTEILSPIHE